MKKLIALLLLSSLGFNSSAQFDDIEFDPMALIDAIVGPIESDRPGHCMNARTAGPFAIQLQTGYQYSRQQFTNDALYTHMVPTTLRISLTSKWELNTSFVYRNTTYDNAGWGFNTKGFRSPNIGIRYSFLRGNGWKPTMGVQVNAAPPSHKGDFQQQNWGTSAILATSNRWDHFSFNTNLGIRFNGDDSGAPDYPWVANFGIPISEKFSCFIEGFGEFDNGTVSADLGIAFSPISDLQIDLFGGMYNIHNDFDTWFAEIGVSYRFSLLKVIAKKKMGDMDMFK